MSGTSGAEKGAKERSRNFPACYLTIRPESGEASEVILWGLSAKYDPRSSTSAYTFEVAGRQWALQLVKKSWPIAFAIRLDRFLYEKQLPAAADVLCVKNISRAPDAGGGTRLLPM